MSNIQKSNQKNNEITNENVDVKIMNNVINDLNQNNIMNNFPVISGYYGIILRKKKHSLFGSYWCKEYCSIQSNVFLCHELKYPFCITKSISIATIMKCETSIIDPCVFSITINQKKKLNSNSNNLSISTVNNNTQNNKTDIKKKKGFFCIFRKNKSKNIKFKCISTLDTQKWTTYINNSIKSWKSNRNLPKSLFSTSQYIEKTMAQEIIEKLNKKIKKSVLQNGIQNLFNIFEQFNLKKLYQSFNKLLINCIFESSKYLIQDNVSVTTYKSDTPKSDNKESFENDLLLIKKRIVSFKIEQGINHLNRIFNKKISDYWRLFKSNVYLMFFENNSIEIHFEHVKLRRIFYFWRLLTIKKTNEIKLLSNRYNKTVNSCISTDSMQTYYTNNTSPILISSSISSSEIVSSKITNMKYDIKYSDENKSIVNKNFVNFTSIDHEIYSEVVKSIIRTPKLIENTNLKEQDLIKSIKYKIDQLFKFNLIILSRKKEAWNFLQTNRIHGNVFFSIYKYNQIQIFSHIVEKNSKLELYKAFKNLSKI